MKPIKGRSVRVDEGQSIEKALRKLKKKVTLANVLNELRDREGYIKPTTQRKQKKAAAKRRWKKYLSSQSLPPKKY
jgi:small subunit ribosomal protein S21